MKSVMNTISYILKERSARRIASFLCINFLFMFVEFAYGFWTNSLGLISDAVHMMFDCGALALGLYGAYMSSWRPNKVYSYGYGRYGVLCGFTNSIFLILVAVCIVIEAIERVLDPPKVESENLFLVSFAGFLVNVVGIIVFSDLHCHSHSHSGCCSKEKQTCGSSESSCCSFQTPSQSGCLAQQTGSHSIGNSSSESKMNDSSSRKSKNVGKSITFAWASCRCSDSKGSIGKEPSSCTRRHREVKVADCHAQAGSETDKGENTHRECSSEQKDVGTNSLGKRTGSLMEKFSSMFSCHADANTQAVFLHILADTLGSVSVMVSSVAMRYDGMYLADPVCSIMIGILIFVSVLPLVKETSSILLQQTPADLLPHLPLVEKKIRGIHGVAAIHQLHTWKLASNTVIGTAHLLVESDGHEQMILHEVTKTLKTYGVAQCTIQIQKRPTVAENAG